ncbi:MAG: DapH/DapD/GlmU-related protein [Massilimicrobiota sp.]|nr:DapH/DapD/GlmU-related protein [Massilimicrobiota sp.]
MEKNKEKRSVLIKWYRVENYFYKHNMVLFSKIIYHMIQIIFGSTIPYQCVLEDGVNFAHFHGIVLNHECFIGKNTKIYHNVTVGGTDKGVPKIGKNCILGANSVVLGNIVIGDNVIVGAGSVVTKSIPSNCTVCGVPAKIIKHKT